MVINGTEATSVAHRPTTCAGSGGGRGHDNLGFGGGDRGLVEVLESVILAGHHNSRQVGRRRVIRALLLGLRPLQAGHLQQTLGLVPTRALLVEALDQVTCGCWLRRLYRLVLRLPLALQLAHFVSYLNTVCFACCQVFSAAAMVPLVNHD